MSQYLAHFGLTTWRSLIELSGVVDLLPPCCRSSRACMAAERNAARTSITPKSATRSRHIIRPFTTKRHGMSLRPPDRPTPRAGHRPAPGRAALPSTSQDHINRSLHGFRGLPGSMPCNHSRTRPFAAGDSTPHARPPAHRAPGTAPAAPGQAGKCGWCRCLPSATAVPPALAS